jgi:hypothetical protein
VPLAPLPVTGVLIIADSVCHPGRACSRHAGTVTNLELALIPAIAALGGVALGIFGNGWLDRLRDRRAVQRERDQAIAELLAATADLVNSIQAARGIYGRSGWRPEIRLVAAVFASIGTAVAREKNLTPGMFLDWRRDAPLLERLLAIWRGQSDHRSRNRYQ